MPDDYLRLAGQNRALLDLCVALLIVAMFEKLTAQTEKQLASTPPEFAEGAKTFAAQLLAAASTVGQIDALQGAPRQGGH